MGLIVRYKIQPQRHSSLAVKGEAYSLSLSEKDERNQEILSGIISTRRWAEMVPTQMDSSLLSDWQTNAYSICRAANQTVGHPEETHSSQRLFGRLSTSPRQLFYTMQFIARFLLVLVVHKNASVLCLWVSDVFVVHDNPRHLCLGALWNHK